MDQSTDSDLPRAYISTPRKDGKIPVQYVYPRSGARIHKLQTAETVRALIAEGKYLCAGYRPS